AGLASRIIWDCSSSGTYYVKIRHYSSSGTGGYDISVRGESGGGGEEIPLSLGVSHSDSLSGTGDWDMYSIEVEGGNTLQVNLDGPSSGADFDLYVRIGAHPTVNVYDARGYTNSADESCEVPVNSANTVYIMVRSYRGSGPYRIIARYIIPQFTSIDTGFDPALDGFNFSNDGTPIDEESPFSFLNVFGTSGICFGMSYASARYFRVLQANPNSGYPHLFDACSENGQTCPIISISEHWATALLNIWNSIWMEAFPETHEEFINTLTADMESEMAPIIVILKKTGESGGHAVLAYKIENNEDYVKVYVYNNWYVYNPQSPDYWFAGKNATDDYILFRKSNRRIDSYEGYDRFHVVEIPSWLW
ncbi:MAG: PPC domain-containing protein, partial [Thermoplasmata archaeon]|nr:PPC domain-containing protein [Thermoplasmata archaeon]